MSIDSHQSARNRFEKTATVNIYPEDFLAHKRRHQRELHNIEQAFRYLDSGMRVLDLPCGTGRLTKLLAAKGMQVTAGDVSEKMLERAKLALEQAPAVEPPVVFHHLDVLHTGFADNSFDAVVCYRLLHHFHEAELRQRALRELARITEGPVIVSIFTSGALDYYFMHLKHWLRPNKPYHRNYLKRDLFEQDIASAGLEVVEAMPRLRFISPVWIYVLRRRQSGS